MKITLEINDNKASAFLNFIKSLDFIKIQDKEATSSKNDILEGIKDGLNEAKLHSEGKIDLQSARDFLNEL